MSLPHSQENVNTRNRTNVSWQCDSVLHGASAGFSDVRLMFSSLGSFNDLEALMPKNFPVFFCTVFELCLCRLQ